MQIYNLTSSSNIYIWCPKSTIAKQNIKTSYTHIKTIKSLPNLARTVCWRERPEAWTGQSRYPRLSCGWSLAHTLNKGMYVIKSVVHTFKAHGYLLPKLVHGVHQPLQHLEDPVFTALRYSSSSSSSSTMRCSNLSSTATLSSTCSYVPHFFFPNVGIGKAAHKTSTNHENNSTKLSLKSKGKMHRFLNMRIMTLSHNHFSYGWIIMTL